MVGDRLRAIRCVVGPIVVSVAGSTGCHDSVRASAAGREGTSMQRRPVHTFSIVARDAATGELGVAVQSHWFSVGTVVSWGEAGVGVVATQSFAEPAYGPRGLALIKSGIPAPAALAALVSADEASAVRQVAFLDAAGRVAAHTGARCIEHASHQIGDGYSVQANMMRNDSVVPAIAKAFEAARGALPERLIAALQAGQAAGGDLRGKQSASLLVVKGQSTGRPWAERAVDLRVEDHPKPIAELSRLYALHRAYERMNAGDVALEEKNAQEALAHYRAAAALAPDNIEVVYWHAVTLATNDRVKEAIPLFRRVFAADPAWVDLTRRLHKPGIIPDTPAGHRLVERILKQASR